MTDRALRHAYRLALAQLGPAGSSTAMLRREIERRAALRRKGGQRDAR